MREIEYRVWHKKEKRMYYFDFWTMTREIPGATSGGFYYPVDGSKMCELTDKQLYSEPTEYTGKRDRNAKEIYDGDIIKWKIGGYRTEGSYISPSVSFAADNEVKIIEIKDITNLPTFKAYTGIGHIERQGTIEIIGNIYENPELLK